MGRRENDKIGFWHKPRTLRKILSAAGQLVGIERRAALSKSQRLENKTLHAALLEQRATINNREE